MFFVLNTDKQASFCILPFGLCLFQLIFYSIGFEMKEEYIMNMILIIAYYVYTYKYATFLFFRGYFWYS